MKKHVGVHGGSSKSMTGLCSICSFPSKLDKDISSDTGVLPALASRSYCRLFSGSADVLNYFHFKSEIHYCSGHVPQYQPISADAEL